MALAKEKLERLHEAMRRGPKSTVTDEELVDMYLKHLSIAKVARELGISSGSIQQRLYRIRKNAGLLGDR